MNAPNPFIIIVDKSGEIWESLSRSASMQSVVYSVAHHDRSRPWCAPHAAWLWNGAVWYPFKIPMNP